MSEALDHDCAQGAALFAFLQSNDIDAAINAGLMHYLPCPHCDTTQAAALVSMQQQLTGQWAARDRYLARQARLARRTAERETRRAASMPAQTRNTLPPAAALILARAKAKAAERGTK
ncbi:MAG: hypothetical protein ABI858_10755 [Pseudoxanthomonas sp.]